MACRITLTVNGQETTVAADKAAPLLHVLRNTLGLRGAHFGCGAEQCGACMVLVDGAPAYACTLRMADAAGRPVTTIEGLGTPEAPHPLQRAFQEEQAGQCGYCLPGILISAAALLERDPAPDRATVCAALEPHLCRCGTHNRIIRAVQRAAAIRAGAPA